MALERKPYRKQKHRTTPGPKRRRRRTEGLRFFYAFRRDIERAVYELLPEGIDVQRSNRGPRSSCRLNVMIEGVYIGYWQFDGLPHIGPHVSPHALSNPKTHMVVDPNIGAYAAPEFMVWLKGRLAELAAEGGAECHS